MVSTPKATDTRQYLTPPAIAKQLHVDVARVRAWIRRGELRAVDLSEPGTTRPRFRVAPQWLDEFLGGKSVVAPPKRRRKRKDDFRYY